MPADFTVFVVAAFLALALGWFLGWLGQRGRLTAQARPIEELTKENRRIQEQLGLSTAQAARHRAMAESERDRAEKLEAERERLAAERQIQESRAVAAETQLTEERKQAAEKLALLTQAREELSGQFKTLATEILEEKSKRFT